VRDAARLVAEVRRRSSPTVMEAFLAEYGLSTEEGVGLMCLAEAMLRVPDARTIDELIADKIEPSNWGAHLGHSASSLVNAATWGLLLTGRVLDDDPSRPAAALRGLVRRIGEPVVRTAVGQAMKLMGRNFVLGETIHSAMDRARTLEARGFTYSYDMLGEAARTHGDAERYARAYADAIGHRRPRDRRRAREPRHLGQALGAAPALRVEPSRRGHGGSRAACPRPRPRGRPCPHRLQHRRRRSRAPRSLARRDRGAARRSRALPAGTGSASSCRPTVGAPWR
jgi:hypothetical protein